MVVWNDSHQVMILLFYKESIRVGCWIVVFFFLLFLAYPTMSFGNSQPSSPLSNIVVVVVVVTIIFHVIQRRRRSPPAAARLLAYWSLTSAVDRFKKKQR
jgi:hypothetical protein